MHAVVVPFANVRKIRVAAFSGGTPVRGLLQVEAGICVFAFKILNLRHAYIIFTIPYEIAKIVNYAKIPGMSLFLIK